MNRKFFALLIVLLTVGIYSQENIKFSGTCRAPLDERGQVMPGLLIPGQIIRPVDVIIPFPENPVFVVCDSLPGTIRIENDLRLDSLLTSQKDSPELAIRCTGDICIFNSDLLGLGGSKKSSGWTFGTQPTRINVNWLRAERMTIKYKGSEFSPVKSGDSYITFAWGKVYLQNIKISGKKIKTVKLADLEQPRSNESSDVEVYCETMPAYPGGPDALAKFFADNIKYPAEAKKSGLEGKVFISFIVEKDGSISAPVIAKSLSDKCDKEVLRVVKLMGKWTPGKNGGKLVRTKVTCPIAFQLQ